MKNLFRKKASPQHSTEERGPIAEPEESDKAKKKKNFFTLLLTDGVISKQTATNMLPFIVFIALLAILYIGNHHHVESSIRKIDKLNKEVDELSWDYKTLKAELMLKSTQTEVSKKADSLGLTEPLYPPKRIETEGILK